MFLERSAAARGLPFNFSVHRYLRWNREFSVASRCPGDAAATGLPTTLQEKVASDVI